VAIRYDASMDELLSLAMSQNFVPVLDDHDIFMGIITRKAIIGYFAQGETSRQ
jgi:predicted transcriptional regulator